MFPFTFPGIYRIAKISLGAWTDQTLLTVALTAAGLSAAELVKVDGVMLIGVTTSAGVHKAIANWKATLGTATIADVPDTPALLITVPATVPAENDIITVAYTLGGMPLYTGALSTP